MTHLLIKPYLRLKRTLFKHLPTGTKQRTKRLGQTLFFQTANSVQFSSEWYLCARKNPRIMLSTPSLRSFPNVAIETVPTFVWIIRGETHSIISQKRSAFRPNRSYGLQTKDERKRFVPVSPRWKQYNAIQLYCLCVEKFARARGFIFFSFLVLIVEYLSVCCLIKGLPPIFAHCFWTFQLSNNNNKRRSVQDVLIFSSEHRSQFCVRLMLCFYCLADFMLQPWYKLYLQKESVVCLDLWMQTFLPSGGMCDN